MQYNKSAIMHKQTFYAVTGAILSRKKVDYF